MKIKSFIIIILLIYLNFNLFTINKFINIQFINASKKGNLELIIKYIKKGADVDYSTYYYNETSLIIASEKGHYEIVNFLLENGANPNHISYPYHYMVVLFDNRFATALLRAVDKNHLEIVKLLIKYGADVNFKETEYGWDATPLYLAIRNNNEKIIKILKESGAKE